MVIIMKSIKPGRGPSYMNFIGSIVISVFGVVWTIGAAIMGAPFVFPLFGVVFVAMGIGQAFYHHKNATSKERFSIYDITEDEPDPLDRWTERQENKTSTASKSESGGDINYCPYCGVKAAETFSFCKNCGKKLPE